MNKHTTVHRPIKQDSHSYKIHNKVMYLQYNKYNIHILYANTSVPTFC